MRNEGPMSLKFSMQTEHDDFQKGSFMLVLDGVNTTANAR